MSQAAQYSGHSHAKRLRKWYIGTDQLEVGYALCYDQNATTGGTDEKVKLGNAVEKPATANLNAFAGIVAARPATVGPCWVEIFAQDAGEFCSAFTDADMTAFTTILTPQNDSYALAALALPADANDDGAEIPPWFMKAIAKAAETVDTDTTNANKIVQFT